MYTVTKTYGHERGLSCTFRQHRATSHCKLLHGYALSFSFVFAAKVLDSRGWVIDFGDLAQLKDELTEMFDHTLLIAGDDPERERLVGLMGEGLANVYVLRDGVGCEAFAREAWQIATDAINNKGQFPRVQCVKVTVSEHGSNSASYIPENVDAG